MKITFVYPAKNAPKWGVPIGISYLGTVLKEAGHSVNIVDMRYSDEKELFSVLKKVSPEMVGFYSSSEIAYAVCELARKIKEILPNSCLVVGGPHPTIDPNFFLNNNFDVVVKGEAEVTIVELADIIEKKKKLSEVDGIVWKDKGKIKENKQRAYIDDLDKLPLPDYSLFPSLDKTLKETLNWANLTPFTHVLVSRGCPYQCTFCQPTLCSMFGGKIRRMSSNRVIELISFLKDKYKIKEIFFEDDLLMNLGWKKWFFEITDGVIKEKMDLRWWGQSRANTSNKEMLRKARDAGCYMVMCGVESGSQKVLDFYNKGITVQQVRDLFRMCKELDLMTVAEIIFGAPVETIEDAEQTVKLMKEIKPDSISICILTPYPGTHLYDWLVGHNVKFENKLDKVDRAIQSKKIESPLSIDDIFRLIQKARIPEPSPTYLLTRGYYRKVYLTKVGNLIKNKEFGKIKNLILSTVSSPIKKKLVYYYYKNPDSKIFNTLKRIGKY